MQSVKNVCNSNKVWKEHNYFVINATLLERFGIIKIQL